MICYCMHGHRASSLFYQLKIAGFEQVRLYDGSFTDWCSRRLAFE
ncbi:MAG: rhodanese-like domain-containing protein [Candidatus Nitrosotenuis sp.]